MYLFFGKDEIKEEDLEALFYKAKIINDWGKVAKEIADSLPFIFDNLAFESEEAAIQKEIEVYQERDQGLGEFVEKPLVDQFNEIFKITEDPLSKIIKKMETKGDDKYAHFNPDDIVFYDDAFNQEF